jgi:hypothetical protein
LAWLLVAQPLIEAATPAISKTANQCHPDLLINAFIEFLPLENWACVLNKRKDCSGVRKEASGGIGREPTKRRESLTKFREILFREVFARDSRPFAGFCSGFPSS